MKDLLNNLRQSLTAFHAVKRAEEILESAGFEQLFEKESWKIKKGGKYFVVRGDSSLIAFRAGERFDFSIAAAHTDSPCFKIKGNPQIERGGCTVLNAEVYGGPIYSTFMDRRLVLAGRAFFDGEKGIASRLVKSPFNVVVPNLAIHQNREVNNGVKLNPQVDMCPVYSAGKGDFTSLLKDALSYDLFVVCAEEGYLWGEKNEFVSAPRLDDLQCCFGALSAFVEAGGENVGVLALLDNEEIGSRTRNAAASTFIKDVVERIAFAYGKNGDEIKQALAQSFMLSLDNAHATHPNHPELDDPTNKTVLGGGLVIKHNANFSYTTDAYSSAHATKLFKDAGVKHQHFYVKSDQKSGGTLGIISAAQLSIPSVDIGLPQLAMHSAIETAAVSDYDELVKALRAYYSVGIKQ